MRSVSVSIIIPVYNVETYIKACLDSVTKQTFSDYELIIVNDGSTDNSPSIINEYSKEKENIVVINQENQGQSAARNRAINIARGEYIYFLDSDDYIDFDTIETLYTDATLNDLDVLLFNGDTFYDNYVRSKTNFGRNYSKNGQYSEISDGLTMFSNLVMNNDYSCSPCLLFIRKSILENKSLNFYEGIIHEDELFTFKLLLSSKSVRHLDKTLFHRRIRENSTMTGLNYLKSYIGYSVVLKEMVNFKNSLNINGYDYVNKAINKKIGYIYGSVINRFCCLSKKNKQKYGFLINEMKTISKNNQYFERYEYRLFYFSQNLYWFLRKIYEIFRKWN